MNIISKILRSTQKKQNIANQILLIFDIAFILLLFLEFIYPNNPSIRLIELWFGGIFVAEFIFRARHAYKKEKSIFTVWNFFDLVIILSIFTRPLFEGSFLLHAISSLRILRSYRAIKMLSKTNNFVSRHIGIVLSTVNLLVFIFIMTAMVFTLQGEKNQAINDYLDALYFTVTTLTTTGYGDITVVEKEGKILVVIIMILGVGLFLKLANSIFKPSKTFFKCKHCGLTHHDSDASHCKHCGNIINIESSG